MNGSVLCFQQPKVAYSTMTLTRILILAANPQNTDRLRLDEEVREILAALEESRNRDEFEIITRWAVRVDDLQKFLLDHNPQIVHFSGHGSGENGLILEDELGNACMVSTNALATLFSLFQVTIQCVCLNACYSEVQAEAIHASIPFVVGMNQPIGDKAAIKFAKGFYRAIGANRSIEEAYEFGRNAIDLQHHPDVSVPVIKRKAEVLNAITRDSRNKEQVPKPIETPLEIETRRRLEAAIPQQSKVGRPTEVRAMIALYDSLGLRAYLPDYTESGELLKRDDVVENDVSLEFPVDPNTQQPQPIEIFIFITAPDFSIEKSVKSIHVPPKYDSGITTFFLTPLVCRKYSRVVIEWFKEEEQRILIGSLTLITEVLRPQDELLKVLWSFTKLTLNSVKATERHSTRRESMKTEHAPGEEEPIVVPMTSPNQNRSVSVSGSMTGSAVGAGDGNTVSIQFQPAALPQPESVSIQAELEALHELLSQLQSPDQRKIEAALDDAKEELKKPDPSKDEVGQALARALNYAQKANGFAKALDKLRPHVEKAAAWLGEHWYKLLPLVGLTV